MLGGFVPDGSVVCLPTINTDRLLRRWRVKIFESLLAVEKMDRQPANRWPKQAPHFPEDGGWRVAAYRQQGSKRGSGPAAAMNLPRNLSHSTGPSHAGSGSTSSQGAPARR